MSIPPAAALCWALDTGSSQTAWPGLQAPRRAGEAERAAADEQGFVLCHRRVKEGVGPTVVPCPAAPCAFVLVHRWAQGSGLRAAGKAVLSRHRGWGMQQVGSEGQ